jgi:hypothetical protein
MARSGKFAPYVSDNEVKTFIDHWQRDVKSLHINGFKAPIFDLSTLQCIGQTANWTFAERLHAICLVLKVEHALS